jgi:hypothetical protein
MATLARPGLDPSPALEGALRAPGGDAMSRDRRAVLDLAGLERACEGLGRRFALLLRRLPLEAFVGGPLLALEELRRQLAVLGRDVAAASEPGLLDEVRSATLAGLAAGGAAAADSRGEQPSLAERLAVLRETIDEVERTFAGAA